jgi:uncharacterized MAPEG superfamily protein
LSGSALLIRGARFAAVFAGQALPILPKAQPQALRATEKGGDMSRELFWLTLTAIMTGLMWTPYIVDRVLVRGLMGAMDNPSPNAKPHSSWAWRQMHAHDNAVENLVIFAILVLVANALHISTNVTAAACATYFWARLAHYVIYTMGVPVLRTLTFVVGFAAEIVLVLAIFRWV